MPSVIALDAMGSDKAPRPEIEGALQAARHHGAHVVLVGPEARLKAELEHYPGARRLPVEVVHASDVITMEDKVEAIRAKRDSSMRVGLRLVREGRAAGFVTALIIVLHIVQPPYNIHPGILGLAVNVTVLCVTAVLLPRPSMQSKPHFTGRSPAAQRFVIICGCVLLALANWPLLTLANRIYPFVLGMPFFIFTMLVLNVSVGLLLLAAYRVSDRTKKFTP